MDRRSHNVYGTPRLAPNAKLEKFETAQLKRSSLLLNTAQRTVVEKAVREVCEYRRYYLRAVNARINHVHTVVSAGSRPEPVMEAFKAYATRQLRAAGLLPAGFKPWARHGSTIYLWKPRHVEMAIDYVINGQGDELPKFE